MSTLIVAVLSFVGFLVAYYTYGRWLARKIFAIDPDAPVPSQQLQDGVDYVPTRKEIVFGHHFTSIAGTGPIVGPAIAVFWGWLPALLWVVFGSILIGAVHDFGALVVSLRNRGQTIGEVAGRMINPRAKVLFLLILFFSLTVVLAIFGLVIALIFSMYPESVLSVWIEIPLAVAIGYWVYKYKGGLLVPSLIALAVMYGAIWVGAYYFPIAIPKVTALGGYGSPVVLWTAILFVYCFLASVLPVWVLLQPRDFINSHELKIALALIALGLLVAASEGKADLVNSAPAWVAPADRPIDAPPMLPFLFITIACGAVSGFHCLVSSGTSSKQVASESHAQFVGYGAMLLEGALAVIVIVACCAGVGMGLVDHAYDADTGKITVELRKDPSTGQTILGREAWLAQYPAKITTATGPDGSQVKTGGWENFKLKQCVEAFVEGGANFLGTIGVPLGMGVGILAVLVASFAATTIDTATRLQRYVIQELAETFSGGSKAREGARGGIAALGLGLFRDKYAATALALVLAGFMAMIPANEKAGPGTGGLILWPLFGATNQLLAGLAFLVIVFYLIRKNRPIWFATIPMVVMVIMPAWALWYQLLTDWLPGGKYLLAGIALVIQALQVWMIVEGFLMWKRAKGVYPELPPLKGTLAGVDSSVEGGRSC